MATSDALQLFGVTLVGATPGDDQAAAEKILLEAAQRHAVSEIDEARLRDLERRYQHIPWRSFAQNFWRLTDNWLELAVRFLSPDHGTREIKDAMSREILNRLDDEGLAIASATYEITGLPALHVELPKS